MMPDSSALDRSACIVFSNSINLLLCIGEVFHCRLSTPLYRLCLRMMSVDRPGLVAEGQAKVSLPKGVFYNPVQEFNRDLTILVISEYERRRRQEWIAKRNRREDHTKPSKFYPLYYFIYCITCDCHSGFHDAQLSMSYDVMSVRSVLRCISMYESAYTCTTTGQNW